MDRTGRWLVASLIFAVLVLPAYAHAACNAGACTDCRDDCTVASTTCGSNCWSSFMTCLDGCTTTYCAPFCQVDYGRCVQGCPAEAPCIAGCESSNGCGTGCTTDTDGDGIGDPTDNCVAVPNPDQANRDGDALGDACDPQTCGNGVVESGEACEGGPCCTSACQLAADGTACSDGDACTSPDQCRGGTCAGGAPKTCVASDVCHTPGTCNPSTGACSNPTRPDGTTCDDAKACTTGDACTAGTCAGTPMACDDHNACTTDSCAGGTCVHTNTTSACDDGDACTSGDRCAGGACIPTAAVDCDDHNTCTTDGCTPSSGCSHAPVAGCACDAGGCTTCRDQCATASASCNDGCWSAFSTCLSHCTTTYCAPFCQVDLGRCLDACPAAPPCQAACDAAGGCGAVCAPLSAPSDADGDGIPDADDNCAAEPNASQSDVDGDGAGDACDADDGSLEPARATLRPGAGGLPKGRIKVDGAFVVATPSDWIDPSEDLTATVTSAGGTTVVTWPAGTCVARGTTRTTCRTVDRAATATFRTRDGVCKWKVKLSKLPMASSLDGPVSVHLRYGVDGIDRGATLASCTVKATTLRCTSS